MAKPLARISGVAVRPGVSRNVRLYTRENIAKLVERAAPASGRHFQLIGLAMAVINVRKMRLDGYRSRLSLVRRRGRDRGAR